MARFDAFISHSSRDAAVAGRVEAALESDYNLWLDQSDIHHGALLRKELRERLLESRCVILLWSGPASQSRWVASELLTAFHLDRHTFPCVLDDVPLPYFLEPAVHLDFRRDEKGQIEALRRSLRGVPAGANQLLPRMASRSAECKEMIQALSRGQAAMIAQLNKRDVFGARQIQEALDNAMGVGLKTWPLDLLILNLAGYHYKNAYMLEHSAAIDAGRPPRDPLLEKAERFFFEALFVDPLDCNGLNGLGSVLILERELEAAEFFVRRAIDLAKRDGIDYSAAEHDLKLIEQYGRQR